MLKDFRKALGSKEYRPLIRDFFDVFSKQANMTQVEVFLLEKEEKITRYWYKKSRVYDDAFTFKDLTETALEHTLIELKERYYYQPSHFVDIKSKENYSANILYIKPVFIGKKMIAVLVIHLNEEMEDPLSLDHLALKLIMMQSQALVQQENHKLKHILSEQGIRYFHVKELKKEVLPLFQDVLDGYERTIKEQERYFSLHAIDSLHGYAVDITDTVALEVKEQLAYMHPKTKLLQYRKFMKDMDELNYPTVMKLEFSQGYLIDVLNKLQSLEYALYQANNGLYILFNSHDKRRLNATIYALEELLKSIPTLRFELGTLRVGLDVKEFDSGLLDRITHSVHRYYEKKEHKEEITRLQKKKMVYQSILSGTYVFKSVAVTNLGHDVFAKLIELPDTFDDLRMELLMLQSFLKQISKDKTNTRYMFELSDDLIDSYDLVQYFKDTYGNHKFWERLTFIYEQNHEPFQTYIMEKNVTIGRRDFERTVKRELYADYLLLCLPYRETSNKMMDVLGFYQSAGIVTPVFEIKQREDIYYLVENQVGYVYMNE